MKRGLGIQGPAVLSRPRRGPGVLELGQGETAADVSRRSFADRRRLAMLMRDLTAAREALAEALTGWESADSEAADRVNAIRRRNGIESDLTDAGGKS